MESSKMKDHPVLAHPFHQMTTRWPAETHQVSHPGGEVLILSTITHSF